jgi:hypothetical protein
MSERGELIKDTVLVTPQSGDMLTGGWGDPPALAWSLSWRNRQ